MIGLDRESEATQALGAPCAQDTMRVIGSGRRGPFQGVDGLVDLDTDVGPALAVVGLRLR